MVIDDLSWCLLIDGDDDERENEGDDPPTTQTNFGKGNQLLIAPGAKPGSSLGPMLLTVLYPGLDHFLLAGRSASPIMLVCLDLAMNFRDVPELTGGMASVF